MVSPLEKLSDTSDKSDLSDASNVFDIISAIRNIRAQKNISPKEVLTLVCPEALPAVVVKLANVELAVGAEKSAGSASFIIGTTEYSVPLEKFINVDEELKKLEAELAHQEGFLRGVMGKLNNERFVQNAKPEVVELERKKKADAEKRIATLKEAIAALG
jgi:valyl-tRNA synthetase